jgi:hypothetical protein
MSPIISTLSGLALPILSGNSDFQVKFIQLTNTPALGTQHSSAACPDSAALECRAPYVKFVGILKS